MSRNQYYHFPFYKLYLRLINHELGRGSTEQLGFGGKLLVSGVPTAVPTAFAKCTNSLPQKSGFRVNSETNYPFWSQIGEQIARL